MKILELTLKKQWYDMILSGEKKEEYREIKEYWTKRLVGKVDCLRGNYPPPFKKFDAIRFRNGYGKNAPSFVIEVDDLRRSTGNPSWGAETGKYYYTFILGKKLDSRILITDPLAGYDN